MISTIILKETNEKIRSVENETPNEALVQDWKTEVIFQMLQKSTMKEPKTCRLRLHKFLKVWWNTGSNIPHQKVSTGVFQQISANSMQWLMKDSFYSNQAEIPNTSFK